MCVCVCVCVCIVSWRMIGADRYICIAHYTLKYVCVKIWIM